MRFLSLLFCAAGVGAFTAPRAARAAPARLAPLESIKITVRSGESVDSVIMRLRREVNKSGHLRTLRHKRYHEDAREKKKRKLAESRRKMKFVRQRKRRAVWPGVSRASAPLAPPPPRAPRPVTPRRPARRSSRAPRGGRADGARAAARAGRPPRAPVGRRARGFRRRPGSTPA